jgi:tetratricopeptide (TPR) repeat protein
LPLSAGCFCLAVLTKESAFSFLALLPLTDYITRKGTLKERFAPLRLIAFYAPFVAATCVLLAIRYWVLGGFVPLYVNPGSNPLANADGWARFLTATRVFAKYLGLLVFPLNLSADYSYNQIPLVTGILSWNGIFPVSLLLFLLIGLAASFRRHAILFFCLFVFFSSFIMTSNWIRPIGTIMAERLMYFPALGFNAALAFLVTEGLARPRWREIAAVTCGLLVAGYAVRIVTRNLDWRDHYALFSSAAQTSPDSSLVQSNYAAVLLHEKKNPAAAIEHAKLAIRILADATPAHFTLGEANRRLGDLDGALAAFENVVRLAPRTSGGAAALKQIAEIRVLRREWAEARSAYEKLIEWRPGDASARRELARIRENR